MSEVRDRDHGGDLMSASMTRTKTPEGGHSGPRKSGVEELEKIETEARESNAVLHKILTALVR